MAALSSRPAAAQTPTITEPTATTDSVLPIESPDLPTIDQLHYRIRTVYRAPSGESAQVHTEGTMFLPIPVDVNGDGLPDIVVQLSGMPGAEAGTGTADLTVRKVSTASLALQVEVILALDPASNGRVAFGYDGRESGAPGAVQGKLTVTKAGTTTNLTAGLTISDPGATLAVIGARYAETSTGGRSNPQDARIRYAPVPATANVVVVEGSSQKSLEVTSDRPTDLDLGLDTTTGSTRLDIDATATGVQRKVRLDYYQGPVAGTPCASPCRARFNYNGDAAGVIGLNVDKLSSNVLTDHIVATLKNPSPAMSVIDDAPTVVRFESTSPVGEIEGGVAKGGRVIKSQTTSDYVNAVTRSGFSSIASRLRGLTSAKVDSGTPLVVDATHAAGPFLISALSGSTTLTASVKDLPATVHLQYAQSGSSHNLTYTGSAPIGEVTAHASNPGGLFGRVKDVDLILRQLPTALTELTVSPTMVKVAADGAIGLTDVQLTSGPGDRITTNGVMFKDLNDAYVVSARLSGVSKGEIRKGDPIHVDVTHAGGAFQVQQQVGSRTTNVTVTDLPATASLDFSPSTQTVTYKGSAAINELVAQVNDTVDIVPRVKKARLLARQIPTELSLTIAPSNSDLTLDTKGNAIGMLELLLTSHPDSSGGGITEDGLLVDDLPGRYEIFGRISGLRRLSTTTSGPIECTFSGFGFGECTTVSEIKADATGNKAFHFNLVRQKSAQDKEEYTMASLDRLVPDVTLRLRDRVPVTCSTILCGGVPKVTGTPRYSQISYQASAAAGRLAFSTNAGQRVSTVAVLTPLPKSMSLCQSTRESFCRDGSRTANPLGSTSFTADQGTTLNVLDCLSGTCPSFSSDFLDAGQCPATSCSFSRIYNLSIQRVTKEQRAHPNDVGELWLDTQGLDLSGDMLDYRDGKEETRVRLAPSFRTSQRYVKWERWLGLPVRVAQSGTAHCPQGTEFLAKGWFNVTYVVCP